MWQQVDQGIGHQNLTTDPKVTRWNDSKYYSTLIATLIDPFDGILFQFLRPLLYYEAWVLGGSGVGRCRQGRVGLADGCSCLADPDVDM